MKKWICCLCAALGCLAAAAQTSGEILARMEKELERSETDGLSMGMDIKIPILGTLRSKVKMTGEKSRTEMSMLGKKMIMWEDRQTSWTYSDDDNTLTIKNVSPDKPSDAEENLSMLNGIDDGYTSEIKKETDETWTIRLTKTRDNPDKDAPKTMDVVVAKATWLPLSISATVKGVKVVMYDLVPGVSEKEVTFNPAAYPDATIKDER